MKIKKPKWAINIYNAGFSDISVKSNPLLWKEKWDTPRIELCPAIYIHIGKIEICIRKGTESEWSKYLWEKYFRERFGDYPWK